MNVSAHAQILNENRSSRGSRILVSSEHPTEALAIETILRREPFDAVRLTTDVREIVPLMDKWGFDLLVLDMHGTLLEDPQIMHDLSKLIEKGRMIMLGIVNPGHEPARLSALIAGATDTITRPVLHTDLIPCVQKVLTYNALGLSA